MARTVVIVIDDLVDIGPIERYIVEMAARDDVGFHIVSTGDAHLVVAGDSSAGDSNAGDWGTGDWAAVELAPRGLRLMVLLARLSDRLIRVTGEIVARREPGELAEAVRRCAPEAVLVAARCRRLERWRRRDVTNQLRRLFAVDVRPIRLAA